MAESPLGPEGHEDRDRAHRMLHALRELESELTAMQVDGREAEQLIHEIETTTDTYSENAYDDE